MNDDRRIYTPGEYRAQMDKAVRLLTRGKRKESREIADEMDTALKEGRVQARPS
ncbi:MAG: hypothetical protein R3F37_16700 [Candidatus Competibacteraceae bacterium]